MEAVNYERWKQEIVNAVVLSGGLVTCDEVAVPKVGRGDVLVRVRAAAINGVDLRSLGSSGARSWFPGLECSGEVLAVGESVTKFVVGQRVMGLVPAGAQAEIVAVPEVTCLAIPDWMDFIQAGAFCEAFTTAHDALFTLGNLKAGDRACIHGAAGGVGCAAVQLAAASDADVVGTVRSVNNRARVKALVHRDIEVVDPVSFPTWGPFDVILELVRGGNMPQNLASLAMRGCVVVIGVGAEPEATIDLRELMHKRGLIVGSVLKSRDETAKGFALQAAASAVLPAISRGEIVVPVARTFPMTRAADAYGYFANGDKFGKVVLIP